MINDSLWISAFDHRVSAAVVFFLLLFLLNTGSRRRLFVPRALISFAVMLAASWVIRSFTDEWTADPRLQSLGHSVHIMAMHVIYLGACFFCYRTGRSEAFYNSILALTIFKLAWNTFKVFSSAMLYGQIAAPWSQYSVAGSLVSYLVYAAVSLLFSFLYKYLVKEPPRHAPQRTMALLTGVFLLLQMVLEYCGQRFTARPEALFLYYLCTLLYTLLNYAALLMIAQLDSFRHENRTMHDFISNKMRYYEMSREGITALQTTCHDLKHQIHAIRSEAGKARFDEYLNELEDAVNEYSAVIESGNPTVDVVLTEKNILCLSQHVLFSYMIDGSLFGFLTDREIYSLFGNALDNALEAVMKIPEPSGRKITLKSNSRGAMVVLQVENTFAGEIALKENEMPRTTKQGSGHGFGLRSIDRIAQKHGGMMSVRAEDGLFKLSVVMKP